MQVYFQQIRPLDQCGADDGIMVGNMLTDFANSKMEKLVGVDDYGQVASAVRIFVFRTVMLSACGFTNISAMLIPLVLSRKLGVASQPPGGAIESETVASVTAHEARIMSDALLFMLATQSAASAVEELLRQFPPLRLMAQTHCWFAPLLQAISQRLVRADSALGVAAIRRLSRRASTAVIPQSSADSAARIHPLHGSRDPSAADHEDAAAAASATVLGTPEAEASVGRSEAFSEFDSLA